MIVESMQAEADSSQRKIGAVFATMNRAEVALECANRLLAQTYPLAGVWIADNSSSDDTIQLLNGLGQPVEVIALEKNLGNAGGIHESIERAFAAGMDAVWILDDDSLPRKNALAELMKHWMPDTVVSPLQIDPQHKDLTWPMMVREMSAWRISERLEDLPQAEVFEVRSAWTGALVSREIYAKAGPVMAELFIRGEDEEYPARIAAAGYGFICVRASVLDHKGPDNLVKWSLFGRSFFVEPEIASWKQYYKIRNMVWMKVRFSGTCSGVVMAATYLLAILRFNGWEPARIQAWWRAVRDGWMNRLGPVDHDSFQ